MRSTGQSQILRQLGRFETTVFLVKISDIGKYHFFSGATMGRAGFGGGVGVQIDGNLQFNSSMCLLDDSSPLIHPEVANAVWEIRGSAMNGAQLPPSFQKTHHLRMI